MIKATDLGRVFQTPAGTVHALQAVSFEASAGTLVVVEGPSGCGKSTLLNLIGLLDSPSSGNLCIEGRSATGLDATKMAVLRKRLHGFLFQDAGLIDRMDILANVELPLIYRGASPSSRASLAQAALEKVGLGHLTRVSVGNLSGGERHRVGLARALVSDPPILVCDEPTASLDEQNGATIINLLVDEAFKGRCVVCSSHDTRLIHRASKTIRLQHGRSTG